MKIYWLLFSDGFVMRGNLAIADAYCRLNNASFRILCETSILTEW